MKKVFLIISICIAASAIHAQSWISSSQISSSVSLFELASAIDDVGNVFSYGHFEGTLGLPDGSTLNSYGGRDYFLVKFLPTGEVDWVEHYGSTSNDYLTGGIDIDASGNVFITGGFQGDFYYTDTDFLTSTGTLDAFLVKVESNGTVSWGENIGQGGFLQYTTTLATDEAGDVLVAGSFRDSITFNETVTLYSVLFKFDAFYAKFNPLNGDLIWAKQAKSRNGLEGIIWDIETSSTSYYLTGTFIDTLDFGNDIITSEYEKSNAFCAKTDFTGNTEWIRQIEGNDIIYGYSSAVDDEGNFYISSFFESDTIYIETSDSNFSEVVENNGDYDMYMIKYLPTGTMDWYSINGSKANDRVFDITFFNNEIYSAGFIADTMYWGRQLTTDPPGNKDMFTGSLTKDGNYRTSNLYPGTGTDEARAIFQNGDKLFTVMRSNSDNLVIGDSIYDSDEGRFYLVLGVIGCLPISVDNTIYNDVETCFGDSTGSIQISATGGFGSPWTYSIDNGSTSSANPFFGDLPAAENYQVVVVDAEGCSQTGPLVALTEPDTLEVQVVSTEDITIDHDGSIVVVAQGGTAPFTYWLQPDGAIQGFGTFTFATGDSGTYVVAVNDLNGCGPVTTDSLVIQEIVIPIDTTGFETLSGVKARVYPNPTTGNLTVEMPFEGRKCQMEVISMTGQVVLKRKVFSNGGVITETLDLSDQAKGLYMLRIDGQTLQSAIMVK